MRLDKIPVPDELPSILRNFAKAALRTQPPDLLCWSYLYFKYCGAVEMEPKPMPPIMTESHLTPMLVQTLATTLVDETGYMKVEDIRNYWTGHLMDSSHLNDLLHIITFTPYQRISKTLFVSLALAHLSPNLKTTMYTVCKFLYEDKMVGVKEFVNIYKYLAELDMGPDTCASVSTKSSSSEDWGPKEPLYEGHDFVVCSCSGQSDASISSPNGSLTPPTCDSETKLMVWQDVSCDDVTRPLAPRRLDCGHTSRDGLAMWREPYASEHAYIGVLELVERKVDSLEQIIEQSIQDLLEEEIEQIEIKAERERNERAMNLEIKKHQFREELLKDKLQSYRDAYIQDTSIDSTNPALLKQLKKTLEAMKHIDVELKHTRILLENQQKEENDETFTKAIEDLRRLRPEHTRSKMKKSGKRKALVLTEDQHKYLSQLGNNWMKPFILQNFRALLRLIDVVLGIPLRSMSPDRCKRPVQDFRSLLKKLIRFVEGRDGGKAPRVHFVEPPAEPEPSEPETKSSNTSVHFQDAADSYDIGPDLANSPGLRYCVPGIGVRVPQNVIDDMVSYLECVSRDQCDMIRLTNLTSILCPVFE